jgi:hypothetical protein
MFTSSMGSTDGDRMCSSSMGSTAGVRKSSSNDGGVTAEALSHIRRLVSSCNGICELSTVLSLVAQEYFRKASPATRENPCAGIESGEYRTCTECRGSFRPGDSAVENARKYGTAVKKCRSCAAGFKSASQRFLYGGRVGSASLRGGVAATPPSAGGTTVVTSNGIVSDATGGRLVTNSLVERVCVGSCPSGRVAGQYGVGLVCIGSCPSGRVVGQCRGQLNGGSGSTRATTAQRGPKAAIRKGAGGQGRGCSKEGRGCC